MITNQSLTFRPARAADRDAVFAMVATVWGGTDYIPEIWDEWLHAEDGPLVVGALGERPAALYKLTGLSPHEDWLEGVRVDPELRGKGFARALVHDAIERTRKRDKRTLRFQTSEQSPTMHRLAEQLGFTLAYAPELYRATPIVGAVAYQPIAIDQLPRLLDDLERSPLLRLTGGQYTYGWTSFDLTAERLREHLQRETVVGVQGDQAWAIIEPSRHGGYWIAHAEGPNDQLTRLFHALHHIATPTETEFQVRMHVPPPAPLIPALVEVGYTLGEQGAARVYEFVLE